MVSLSVLNFPFSAVAGQGQYKLALLLSAVNPLVGGVLVSGPRGCAKSTLAKGLADIMPCREKSSSHFVTLPLGASEEMLIGTLNLQQVLNEKRVEFLPGLLAKAHDGVLYVDEVNLLPDNLVDQLLDVAASGVNIVERDGVSHQHPAQFILLGTMNPDEGELRPQLTDRFGLSIELSNQHSLQERVDIVTLREDFDKNPEDFCKRYAQEQAELSNTIFQARAILNKVDCAKEHRHLIAQRCHDAGVDGLRGDIVWVQAVLAKAALEQRTAVTEEDVLAVEELVLAHRRKHNVSPPNDMTRTPRQQVFSRPSEGEKNHSIGDWGEMDRPNEQQTQELEKIALPQNWKIEKAFGAKQGFSFNSSPGSAKGYQVSNDRSQKLNWFSTLLANSGSWPLETLRYKPKRKGCAVIHMILLDTSGSILANRSFSKAKGLILQIAEQAYLQREQVVIIGFGNQKVDTLLSLRRAPKAIKNVLNNIKAAGGTPLGDALLHASEFQEQQLRENTSVQFNSYIITDGRISELTRQVQLKGEVKVFDVEHSQVKRGRGRHIADVLSAGYYPLFS